jgi:hypothetical protein
MENRKTCIRCCGRMFLEFDYDTQRYDNVCISCGHLEPSTSPGPGRPDNKPAAGKNMDRLKTRDLLRA